MRKDRTYTSNDIQMHGARFPVEGSITMSAENFPKELLDQMLSTGQIPTLNIRLGSVFLRDGMTMEADGLGVDLVFDFVANAVYVEEA